MKQLKSTLIITAIATLLCASNSHAAKSFYKWVDDQGTTHYAEHPPSEIETSKVRTTNIHGEATATNQAATDDSSKPTPPPALAASEKSAENCAIVRKNLQTLTTYGRIKVTDGDTKRFLSDEEIQQRKAEAQAEISKYCD